MNPGSSLHCADPDTHSASPFISPKQTLTKVLIEGICEMVNFTENYGVHQGRHRRGPKVTHKASAVTELRFLPFLNPFHFPQSLSLSSRSLLSPLQEQCHLPFIFSHGTTAFAFIALFFVSQSPGTFLPAPRGWKGFLATKTVPASKRNSDAS